MPKYVVVFGLPAYGAGWTLTQAGFDTQELANSASDTWRTEHGEQSFATVMQTSAEGA